MNPFAEQIQWVKEEFGVLAAIAFSVALFWVFNRIIAWRGPKALDYDGTNPNAPPDGYGCPKCRYEYESHVKICPDCDVPLVDNVRQHLERIAP